MQAKLSFLLLATFTTVGCVPHKSANLSESDGQVKDQKVLALYYDGVSEAGKSDLTLKLYFEHSSGSRKHIAPIAVVKNLGSKIKNEAIAIFSFEKIEQLKKEYTVSSLAGEQYKSEELDFQLRAEIFENGALIPLIMRSDLLIGSYRLPLGPTKQPNIATAVDSKSFRSAFSEVTGETDSNGKFLSDKPLNASLTGAWVKNIELAKEIAMRRK